jgi:ABC-type uncharacterized transport system involved in gliding motility auxiliary subunit
MSAFPLARSVTPISGGANGHTAQPIIETSQASWAETDIKDLLAQKEPKFDEGKDKQGPVSLAAAVSAASTATAPSGKPGEDAPKPETRFVVIGDSDFASNAFLGIPGNRNLYMNFVGWLSQQENLISIRPKEAEDRRLTLTSTQQFWISWFSVAIFPLLIFGAGVYTWWRKR